VLRIRIYVVQILNTGTGTIISFKLINTYEISVADPDLSDQIPNIGTGKSISFRLIRGYVKSVFRIRNTGTNTNISFILINTNEISVANKCGTDPQQWYHYDYIL
jgi:hypothetical protein